MVNMAMYRECWDEVRERVLDGDLFCVGSMLALGDGDDYKFITESKLFLLDICTLEDSIEKSNENEIVKACEQLKTDLQLELSTTCSSKLPEAEAWAIVLAWLNILQD